ncbi:hypothetical protein SRCM101294_00815 [Bacillus amyloliquefaciens]|nr:hypothetical protein SRCM101294_00815 [Bacillus amyloliquefaciens]
MRNFVKKEMLFYSTVALVAFISLFFTDRLFFVILVLGILINTYYCGRSIRKISLNLFVALLLFMAQLTWHFE